MLNRMNLLIKDHISQNELKWGELDKSRFTDHSRILLVTKRARLSLKTRVTRQIRKMIKVLLVIVRCTQITMIQTMMIMPTKITVNMEKKTHRRLIILMMINQMAIKTC